MPPPLAYYHGGTPYPPDYHAVPKNAFDVIPHKKKGLQNGTTPAYPQAPPKLSIQGLIKPQARGTRPLNVNEALQFSPLSSIVPFDSGIVTLPNAQISVSHSIFSSLPKEQGAGQQLGYLDAATQNGERAIVRNALGGVQSLLDPMKITDLYVSGHLQLEYLR
ncbi:MAG: hypothetical protein LQ340_002210 [Diploschistes diacapsis]|nr:MAG: hypothetical protein LQ340_002210 [Diploschistes diacapsis]